MPERTVYLVAEEGPLLKEQLLAHGFRLLIGDGTLNDEYLAAADAIVPAKARITAEVLDKAPHCRIIAKFGVGMDRIDIDACTERGIYACNTPTANFVSVAEHTVALMLSAAKRIPDIQRYLHRADPDWKGARRSKAIELSGKTVAVIGFGNIGSRVGRLLSMFDMRILAYDPYIPESRVPEYAELTRDLDYALKAADFVTIHVAGTGATNHLIGARELGLMKPSAILINTTRGFVIEEPALIEALQNGIIAGAALDVFTNEPVEAGNPLLTMDNVIVTPHAAAFTPEARVRAEEVSAKSIIDCLEKGAPEHPLNHPVNPRS